MDTKTKNSLSWLALGASLLLAAWLAYESYFRIIGLKNNDQEFHFGESSISNEVQADVSMDKVIAAHLFGVEPVEAKVEAPKVVDAPITRLNLKLTGIISGATPELSYAMIEITRGQTSVVAIGNPIGNTGADLHDIGEDHILIDHRGKIEKLELERELLSFTAPTIIQPTTIEALNLSESELSALTQVSESKTLVQPEETLQFNDGSYEISESLGSIDGPDDEEFQDDEEDLEAGE